MSGHPLSKALNHLIEINTDADAGFRTAAANVKNSEIETLLLGYADQHAGFAVELQAELERKDEAVTHSGTLGGVVHRAWMDLKAGLSGHSVEGMLASCADGEQSAESAYLDAMETVPSGRAHTLLDKHCRQIKSFQNRLSRLVAEVKKGLEYPQNE